MSNRVYESMTRLHIGFYVVRVWMSEAGVVMGPRKDVMMALDHGMKLEEIVEALDRLNPAAFEIVKDGQGVVVYPDWD